MERVCPASNSFFHSATKILCGKSRKISMRWACTGDCRLILARLLRATRVCAPPGASAKTPRGSTVRETRHPRRRQSTRSDDMPVFYKNPARKVNRAENQRFTQFSRKSPHSKNQYMEDGRMAARCPKASFALFSVFRERGLRCFPWLMPYKNCLHPKAAQWNMARTK